MDGLRRGEPYCPHEEMANGSSSDGRCSGSGSTSDARMKTPCLLVCLVLAGAPAAAQNGTDAGRFIVEHPTLLNLGFEWSIRGDANRNASVAVTFRAAGETAWRTALPLVRIGGEQVFRRREHLEYVVPDGFAGSILNLQPDTEYECRFVLTDPDGVTGQASQTARVRTRAEPQRFDGRPDAARLSTRPSGPEGGTELHQPAPGVLRRRTRRLERRLGAAGRSPATRSSCTPASTGPSGSTTWIPRWRHSTGR